MSNLWASIPGFAFRLGLKELLIWSAISVFSLFLSRLAGDRCSVSTPTYVSEESSSLNAFCCGFPFLLESSFVQCLLIPLYTNASSVYLLATVSKENKKFFSECFRGAVEN
jgi:hypothetical protein